MGTPAVGSRFDAGEGKFARVLEYVGLNPAPEYEAMDRYVVRVVETHPGGPPIGTESKVEERWFETHRRATRAVRP